MSRPPMPPPICDGPGCGKQKQESTHWWIVLVAESVPGEMLIRPATPNLTADDQKDSLWNLYDFCGQTCALKFISQEMGKAESNAK